MQTKYSLLLLISLFFTNSLFSQVEVTNPFEDLDRNGVVNEEESVMRTSASYADLKKLLDEKNSKGYFCFTEDRLHDIKLNDKIPNRWTKRTKQSRTILKDQCSPGEFHTWQIGIYTPFKDLDNISVAFKDLKNEKEDIIKATSLRCFNLHGINTKGDDFDIELSIKKGNVQALWIGTEIPIDAKGTYKGYVIVDASNAKSTKIYYEINVDGDIIENHGDNEGWRKTRLRWLDSSIGNSEEVTSPYTALNANNKRVKWLGGTLEISPTGLPKMITTNYTESNLLDATVVNNILNREISFIVETSNGIEKFKVDSIRIDKSTDATYNWTVVQSSKDFEIVCSASFAFDGLVEYQINVNSLNSVDIKDIRLEVPYSSFASKYLMGLGHKGGLRKNSKINWNWDVDKHQDKIWMGNINAGLNFCFKDENYVRPLVNIYYELGKINLPKSWGNDNKGGIQIDQEKDGEVVMIAYSGSRIMNKGEQLHYNFNMLITPVKPIDLNGIATERFYHSNSDVSANYIKSAKSEGANWINIHHKKDIYPFINYPYYDESVSDLKKFIDDAKKQNIGTRLYYTTRELTVKIPEIWALRSLGGEIIHDGPGKDARTLIHKNGPNEWLNKNFNTNFIPAWYNAFKEGKYAGDMDISIITTPDSRWNNYYLEGLDWMIHNINLGGVYIDDSALDHKTLQRARRIMDKDNKKRLIDIHSWNHMNSWAGYANSLHIYLELLPYVDRTWIGEGFGDNNPLDFWLIEMSGIPFGLLSETLDARNQFKGIVFGMLPRFPWSGNPTSLWKLWDNFGMKDAKMIGYWDSNNPIKTNNENLPATIFINDDKALIAIANWSDSQIETNIVIDEELLGFKPASISFPMIDNLQKEKNSVDLIKSIDIPEKGGVILLIEK